MTELEVLPYLAREWRTTPDIVRDVYEAEGRRGDLGTVVRRTLHALNMMERRGKVERNGAVLPHEWRLAE